MKDGFGNRLPDDEEANIKQKISDETQRFDADPLHLRLAKIAREHGVAVEAVEAALTALRQGGGTMAQFSHPDFGGMAQWSAGGMSMVGDMFNPATKAKLDGVLRDLGDALRRGDLLVDEPGTSGPRNREQPNDWPREFGSAATTGSQNDMRYAFFPSARRLVVDDEGKRTTYDTGEHMISGVSQQQSSDRSLTFRSQLGAVTVADFLVVG